MTWTIGVLGHGQRATTSARRWTLLSCVCQGVTCASAAATLVLVFSIGGGAFAATPALAASTPHAYPNAPTAVTETSAILHGLVFYYEAPKGSAEAETTWQFEFATSQNGPWSKVGTPKTLSIEDTEFHPVELEKSGLNPNTTYYFRVSVENINGASTSNATSFETYGPPSAETLPVHGIHVIKGTPGGILHAIGAVVPNGFDTHYYFEYVTHDKFTRSEFAEASSTQAIDVGPGGYEGHQTVIVGQDLPGLKTGETYDYRIVATGTGPGSPVVSGSVQSLTMPVPGETAAGGQSAQPDPCPNEALRIGASAHLPDCRAYEQVTPAEKEGAQDNWVYGATQSITTPGRDGEHVAVSSLSKWGQNVNPGGDTIYLFSRTPTGWQMTSTTPQPQTGGNHYGISEFFSADLSNFLIESEWEVTFFNASPEKEFLIGPASGPYTKVASAPRSDQTGWTAQSRDGKVAVLKTEDHELLGSSTGTTEGFDLYEWRDGGLRQLNVSTGGSAIGTCGARVVHGWEAEGQGTELGQTFAEVSSINALSSDGSRIFFEAVPGSSCGEEHHLYMRKNGNETTDIGAYSFRGANAEGTMLLLSKGGYCPVAPTTPCEGAEFFSYNTDTATLKPLFVPGAIPMNRHVVSEDGNVVYFGTDERLTPEAPAIASDSGPGADNVYRYDIETGAMTWVAQPAYNSGGGGGGYYTSPNGDYFYWSSEGGSELAVPGVPSSTSIQSYRYDANEQVIQCMSCASSFNPEPERRSAIMTNDGPAPEKPAPLGMPASANGDFAFFESQSELVPSDIDGEVAEPGLGGSGASPSSDVYEWRRNGVDGCAEIQGCLALISSGIDGTKNEFLGTTPSGRDVFIATHSQLVPQDGDASGDIYDVRIGGGYPPPPPRPIECEGDACSAAMPAPTDATPGSSTYRGPGNEHPLGSVKTGAKKRTKARHKSHRSKRGRHHSKKTRKRRSGKRRARAGRGGGK